MKESLIKGDRIPFTQIANAVLNDKNLSWKAKGLYAYLYSKPHNWDFSGERIAYDSKEGRRAVYASLKELEQAGYLNRERKPNGKMVYKITIKPLAPLSQEGRKPLVQKRKELKQQSAEIGSISNKENTTNKENTLTPPNPQRGNKGRVNEIVEEVMPYIEARWDDSGRAEQILPNLHIQASRNNGDVVWRYPTLIAMYLEDTFHEGWSSKESFLASFRAKLRVLVEANLGKIETSDWRAALDRTETFERRTIKTVVNAL